MHAAVSPRPACPRPPGLPPGFGPPAAALPSAHPTRRPATPPPCSIHHSFLPAFEGARPYHRAHDRGVKVIGATAHYATSGEALLTIDCLLPWVHAYLARVSRVPPLPSWCTCFQQTSCRFSLLSRCRPGCVRLPAHADLDCGPIIAQDVTHVTHRDTVPDMVRKVGRCRGQYARRRARHQAWPQPSVEPPHKLDPTLLVAVVHCWR